MNIEIEEWSRASWIYSIIENVQEVVVLDLKPSVWHKIGKVFENDGTMKERLMGVGEWCKGGNYVFFFFFKIKN